MSSATWRRLRSMSVLGTLQTTEHQAEASIARKYGDVGESENHKGHKGTQRKTGQQERGKAFDRRVRGKRTQRTKVWRRWEERQPQRTQRYTKENGAGSARKSFYIAEFAEKGR